MSLAAGLLALVVAATPLLPARGESAGYRFNGVAVDHADADSVVVRYSYGWAGSEFPGWVTCVWSVEDADGETVAEKAIQLVGLKRSYASKQVEIPKGPGAERGRPERARVSCDDSRLDDPNGAYAFSEVVAELAPEFAGDRRSVTLRFDVEWSAAGMPGVGECTARVQAEDGAFLFDHPFTLTSADGSSLSMRAIAPSELPRDPARAEISCEPYSG